jgi:glycosyltransferase involved in cell wall biosynthesis
MFPDVGVLGLVPEPWGGLWMGRHHLLTGLARYFHVVWMDPAPEWRDALRGRAGRPLAVPASPPRRAGFEVFRPGPFRPRLYRPAWLARAIERSRLRAARERLGRRGAGRVVLSLWRPGFAPALDLVPHDVSCYHVADEYTFSSQDLPTPPDEAALLARADQVVVHSEGLLEKKGGVNPHTALIPNGVDFEAFATPAAEPDDLRAIPRPRIGYVGHVKEQLDFALLAGLARARPGWQFVFLGPVRDRPDVRAALAPLAALPNCHLLGPRPTAALPGYVQALDVATMCYVEDGYTRYISPLKLYEYLATGRPVVATPIRSLRRLGSLIRLARGEAEWLAAFDAALSPQATAPEVVANRRAAARAHDWRLLSARLAGLICERLGIDATSLIGLPETPTLSALPGRPA